MPPSVDTEMTQVVMPAFMVLIKILGALMIPIIIIHVALFFARRFREALEHGDYSVSQYEPKTVNEWDVPKKKSKYTAPTLSARSGVFHTHSQHDDIEIVPALPTLLVMEAINDNSGTGSDSGSG